MSAQLLEGTGVDVVSCEACSGNVFLCLPLPPLESIYSRVIFSDRYLIFCFESVNFFFWRSFVSVGPALSVGRGSARVGTLSALFTHDTPDTKSVVQPCTLSWKTAFGPKLNVKVRFRDGPLSCNIHFVQKLPVLLNSSRKCTCANTRLVFSAVFHFSLLQGELVTKFTALTGRPPIVVAGMTPTTSFNGGPLVAACANAGYVL